MPASRQGVVKILNRIWFVYFGKEKILIFIPLTLKPLILMKKIFLLVAVVGMLSSCMNNNTATNNKAAASKAKVQRFYDEVIIAHNTAMIDSFCTAEFVDHNPDQGHSGKGIDDLKASFKDFFTAFPDAHVTPNIVVAEGDTVMALLTMTGTNSGPMGPMPATNKQISIQGTDILIIKDGKATDRWGVFDNMAMMTQMGMMPAPGAPAADAKMGDMKMDEKKK
jgi:predicted ester cyclase